MRKQEWRGGSPKSGFGGGGQERERQEQPSLEEVQLGTEFGRGPMDLLSWETSLYAFISHLFHLNLATSMAMLRADLCPGDSPGSLHLSEVHLSEAATVFPVWHLGVPQGP